jgi:hypothetical protein
MGFERLKIFRKVELDIDTEGPMTVQVYTDLPGQDMRLRHSETINTEETTAGRRTVTVRMPGWLKGRLMKLRLAGVAVVRLYAARVRARTVGGADSWAWYPVPVEVTPDTFMVAKLPIEPTPEGWVEAKLPIEPTPEGWAEAKLPIDPTPEGWGSAPLPIRPTPKERTWVEIPVAIVE